MTIKEFFNSFYQHSESEECLSILSASELKLDSDKIKNDKAKKEADNLLQVIQKELRKCRDCGNNHMMLPKLYYSISHLGKEKFEYRITQLGFKITRETGDNKDDEYYVLRW